MSDNSGSSGILGVIIGAALVVMLGIFFIGNVFTGPTKSTVDVNVKPAAPSASAPATPAPAPKS